ncbi:aminomethyl-transferring glycine dehydrogenase subunit GcvPA [bacterium]|nr:aminomethyl-transferring glycine dehydrogenase subunit GcvPA [bacterium]
MHNFQAHTQKIREEMLKEIGVSSINDLFAQIPAQARVEKLNLANPMSELEASIEVEKLAKTNNTDYLSFMGAGAYNHFVPAAVNEITSRFEFNTAYTPYQAEISQGTLQGIYEFQSLICNLTGMDVATASHYDSATACAEALLMGSRINKINKVLIADTLNPQYLEVVKTYLNAANIEFDFVKTVDLKTDIEDLKVKVQSGIYSVVLLQNPNFYGSLEEIDEIKTIFDNQKTILAMCVNPMTLGVLKSPNEYGAQIVVGDTQPFGCPISFGGPYCGFIATVDKHKRQLAGRIVGKTVDKDGNSAFCLTLQAREQHIRREKATGNICSNQGLNSLTAVIYLALMGENGLKDVAYLSAKNAHNLAKELNKKGVKVLSKDFFNEFVIEVENSDKFLADMQTKGILAGVKLDDERILVCLTEKNPEYTQNEYIKALGV